MLKSYIGKVIEKTDLTENEAIEAMNIIMDGNATQAQIGSLITALRMKGETIDEITGFAKVMRFKAERIVPEVEFCIDTCGTGGDGANTFNVSTAATFVVSAAGVPVAKHGNRSVSSQCGSADVLEALGCRIDLEPQKVKECIEKIGIGFMFAPNFHKSMKNAAGPRKELGIRTVFNILGPLTNPASANGQLMGVFKADLTEKMAKVLEKLGTERALVIHGSDGLDEITLGGPTFITELADGVVKSYTICPEDYGLESMDVSKIKGGDKMLNASIVKDILRGKSGATREIVVLNSAAALYVGKKVESIADGIKMAREIIDSGKALQRLKEFVELTNALAEIG